MKSRQVKAKKSFGQHFLNNTQAAQKIADSTYDFGCKNVLEIGPGMGALTKYLLPKKFNLKVCEVDNDSVAFLRTEFTETDFEIIHADFLKLDLSQIFNGEQFIIVGNFPYNISSQIVFKIIENREYCIGMTGMFQLEVAKRLAATEGKKDYGIIGILTQCFFESRLIIQLNEDDFTPPPKVKSGVIELYPKSEINTVFLNPKFKSLVKVAFNQRRKTLRNALSQFGLGADHEFSKLRAEQLSLNDFVTLFNHIHKS
ncbi:MAG: 16S rRNA (adenine(1518)-N(6)/adenine(1519)-N(6))-dimethyltransferase RsmA [Bacteroidia bacterium]|jgi:16S rRNA (adenine1518-N6/adenine1519-N6)-dimethyltransferase